ncbi:hypothetical protein [Aquifex aeolicus]|uniref:hypothetical protein n=1 Tax=Aquifex aeolicus TaxID=63363 RepID=UPI0003151C8C|nr:hypothetical protein [Aquifex aeolicus]
MWRIFFTRFFVRFILFPLLAVIMGVLVLGTIFFITYTWLIWQTIKIMDEHPLLGFFFVILEILLLSLIALAGLYLFDKVREFFKERRLI